MGYHLPVMLNECIEGLNIRPDGTYVDATFGGGGHSRAILSHLGEGGRLIAFDQDADALENALDDSRFTLLNENFRHMKSFLRLHGVRSVDGVLADLGVSSHQFDVAERGFSTRLNGELDLRMDRREGVSAQEWLRTVSADDLAAALRKNADMDRAFKLSTRLVEMAAAVSGEGRDILPSDMKAVVESVFPDKKREVNGLLARVFQAIRMEVNGELKEIEDSLRAAVDCLKVGGRLVVMSYHSVEDRCVKETAAEFEKACICPEHMPVCMCGGNHQRLKKVNRKPILPSDEEIANNSRARSAKLRVYERV